jgi:hypothetical protein
MILIPLVQAGYAHHSHTPVAERNQGETLYDAIHTNSSAHHPYYRAYARSVPEKRAVFGRDKTRDDDEQLSVQHISN